MVNCCLPGKQWGSSRCAENTWPPTGEEKVASCMQVCCQHAIWTRLMPIPHWFIDHKSGTRYWPWPWKLSRKRNRPDAGLHNFLFFFFLYSFIFCIDDPVYESNLGRSSRKLVPVGMGARKGWDTSSKNVALCVLSSIFGVLALQWFQ